MTDVTPRPLPDGPEDDLGAAATLPGKRGADSGGGANGGDGNGGGGRTRRRRRRRGGRATLVVALALIVGLALVPVVASAFAKTPKDRIGISYGGGPFEAARFQKIVEPGSSLFFNGFFDDLYLYPADQRNYIVAGSVESDDPGTGTITAPTRDRVQVGYQVAVYYRLNTDQLRSFHEELGLKYEAYTADGWNDLIEDTFRQQIEVALQEQTRRYDVADLFGDVDVLITLQDEVEASLSAGLRAATGEDYFCSPTFEPGGECLPPNFVVKKIDIPTSVATSFEALRNSEIDIERRAAEAEAIEVLSDALAEAGDDYNLLRAIESGQITFWVLPDGGVTIAAPEDAAPPAPGG
jgi:regulator of protease activity HflC (stomatin/prohibitin superfamily)